MRTNSICSTDCDCAACQCPSCGAGSDNFVTHDPIMEEVLKPLFDHWRCTKCKHKWGVYK